MATVAEDAEEIFNRLVRVGIFKAESRNAFIMGYLDGRWTSPPVIPGYGVMQLTTNGTEVALYYGPTV